MHGFIKSHVKTAADKSLEERDPYLSSEEYTIIKKADATLHQCNSKCATDKTLEERDPYIFTSTRIYTK